MESVRITMNKFFPEKELGFILMKGFYRIRNNYGSGHREKIYERAIGEWLNLNKIVYVFQPRIDIYSLDTGKKIGIYIPDVLAANKIPIEVKAMPFTTKENEHQIISYLKSSEYEIAYLVNFGEKDFKPRRFIYTNDRKSFIKIKQVITDKESVESVICEDL